MQLPGYNYYFSSTETINMKLLDIMMIIVLQSIGECAVSTVCQETTGSPVVHGCESNYNSSTDILLDTGSNYQYMRCKCTIALRSIPTRLVLVADNGIKLYNHTIQIEHLVLNRSATSGSITLTTKANLWLTSGDKRGTCVTISANNSITISCFAAQTTTAATATTTTINTESNTPVPAAATPQHTEEYFSSTRDLKDNYIDNTIHLAGPVAGGVSGLFLLVIATTGIAICCKRNASNEKESKGRRGHADSANTDLDIYTTENPMYESADGDDRLPFLGGTSQIPSQNSAVKNSESGRQGNINSEYHYTCVSDIEQATGNQNNESEAKLSKNSTETKQSQKDHSTGVEWNAEGIHLPEYSAYDKLNDEQTASENNVYNCTENPNNPILSSWNDE